MRYFYFSYSFVLKKPKSTPITGVGAIFHYSKKMPSHNEVRELIAASQTINENEEFNCIVTNIFEFNSKEDYENFSSNSLMQENWEPAGLNDVITPITLKDKFVFLYSTLQKSNVDKIPVEHFVLKELFNYDLEFPPTFEKMLGYSKFGDLEWYGFFLKENDYHVALLKNNELEVLEINQSSCFSFNKEILDSLIAFQIKNKLKDS